MYLVPARGVARHERHDIFPGGPIDRDAARVFLEMRCCVREVRHLGLRFAAGGLELNIDVVRRQIDDLALQIGATPSARKARRMVGKWYRSLLSNVSTATFGLPITPVAAGF